MYNTSYECRYYKDTVFLDTDNINEDEKDYVRNILYREDLLNIFTINYDGSTEDFDDEIVDDLGKMIDKLDIFINNLYNKTNDIKLKECMKMAASLVMSDKEETGLFILYSYDFMYLTHKCVCEYLLTHTISDINIQNLKDKLHTMNVRINT